MDCKAAVRWVRANAKQYGIDPDRIGALGGSAGGHLVEMLGTSHKAAELEGDGPNQGVSSRVQAVVGMAAPSDMTRYAQRTGASEEMARLISPISHVDADSAPILLIHSDADGTVPHQQSVDMEAKCRKAGVPAKLHTVKDGPHAFWNFQRWFNDTMDLSINFFRETLPWTE
jgi:pectinesterase